VLLKSFSEGDEHWHRGTGPAGLGLILPVFKKKSERVG
jgi:hypothetical protein